MIIYIFFYVQIIDDSPFILLHISSRVENVDTKELK